MNILLEQEIIKRYGKLSEIDYLNISPLFEYFYLFTNFDGFEKMKKLRGLEISDSSKLISFNGIEKLTKLKSLYLDKVNSNTNFESLKNIEIAYLNIKNSSLTEKQLEYLPSRLFYLHFDTVDLPNFKFLFKSKNLFYLYIKMFSIKDIRWISFLKYLENLNLYEISKSLTIEDIKENLFKLNLRYFNSNISSLEYLDFKQWDELMKTPRRVYKINNILSELS